MLKTIMSVLPLFGFLNSAIVRIFFFLFWGLNDTKCLYLLDVKQTQICIKLLAYITYLHKVVCNILYLMAKLHLSGNSGYCSLWLYFVASLYSAPAFLGGAGWLPEQRALPLQLCLHSDIWGLSAIPDKELSTH